MASNGESTVSQVSINQRAEALEKAESEAAAKAAAEAEAKSKVDKEAADKANADKAAAEKAEADRKAAEAESANKSKEKPEPKDKKIPNDPDEMRKWNTRVSQENKKLSSELSALKEAQEKMFKMLASMSKKTVDYKELAKDPEKLQKFIEEERTNATAEMEEKLKQQANELRERDTVVERMRREQDTENYPEWKRLFPFIAKLALGPTGQGDPRVDYTKPAAEVLDRLYEIALQENPKGAEPEKKETPVVEKTYTESEMKSIMADMIAKEKEAIAKSAREAALKEAQDQLNQEAKGGTVASAGKGAGRIPSDQLAAFKKMSLDDQRAWLQANSPQ